MILGVDPGMTGALALIDNDGSLRQVFDMPVVGKDISATMIAAILKPYVSILRVAVVEQVASMPGQGVHSVFKFGMGYGKVLGVLGTLEIPIVDVTPAHWKREMHLGKDKDLSRELAVKTWPKSSELFKLKKNADRAEAALLSLWWLQNHGGLSRAEPSTGRTLRRPS